MEEKLHLGDFSFSDQSMIQVDAVNKTLFVNFDGKKGYADLTQEEVETVNAIFLKVRWEN